MGQTGGDERNQRQLAVALASNWIQFVLLLVALVSFALHGESRLSKIEQRMDDAEVTRGEMQTQLDRIEQRIFKRTP
jgi:hypothetical protein